jgi:hypothetical protein
MADSPMTFTANKDGSISIKDGDKEVRFVKEADLLTVKGGADASERKLKDSETNWNTKESDYKSQLSQHTDAKLAAEARAKNAEDKVTSFNTIQGDYTKVKQDLEAEKTKGVASLTKALEYRRQLVVSTFGIPVDTVKDKTMEQLDSYEEALKAVSKAKGAGNYVASPGGAGAQTQTAEERAHKILVAAYAKQGIKID